MQIKQFITITITTPTTATTPTTLTTAFTATTPTTHNTATAGTRASSRASTPSTHSTRTGRTLQVLARHCGLVVYMAFSHEVLAVRLPMVPSCWLRQFCFLVIISCLSRENKSKDSAFLWRQK